MLDKILDSDDPAKARKALVALSIFTMFFVNLQINSSEMSILGLKIGIDHHRSIGLLKIGVLYLSIVYILRTLPLVFNFIGQIRLRQLASQNEVNVQSLVSSWGFDEPTEPDHTPDGEFKVVEESFNYLKKRVERANETAIFWLGAVGVVVLDYLLPLVLAYLAFSKSNVLGKLIAVLS